MRNLFFLISWFIFSISFTTNLFSQDIIPLVNPSFEDVPAPGKTPNGWTNCGSEKYGPPNIHPDIIKPIFGVKKDAFEGNTYLGLVVRDDNTNDALGQKLSIPLQGQQCYVINMILSKSLDYESVSPKTGEFTFFKAPVRIILWGGYEMGHKQEILAQSTAIENLDWADYQFLFQPSKTFTHIVLEAYYVGNEGLAYNGNILVDFISPIIVADCQTGKETAKPANRKPKKPKTTIRRSNRNALANLDSLKALIQQLTPTILLEKDGGGINPAGKAALLKIAEAKLDFGRYRLIVLLKETNLENDEMAKNSFEVNATEFLIKKEIPATTFRFYQSKNPLPNVDWIAENGFLKIGLRDRLGSKE